MVSSLKGETADPMATLTSGNPSLEGNPPNGDVHRIQDQPPTGILAVVVWLSEMFTTPHGQGIRTSR